MSPDPAPATRTFLASAALALAGAAVAMVAQALGVLPGPRALPLTPLHLLAGAALLALWGLLTWYFPSFMKRSLVSSTLADVALTLQSAALLLVAGAWMARLSAVYARAAAALAAIGFAFMALLLPTSAMVGKKWRGGVPLFSQDTPFARCDRNALALFAISLGGLVVAAYWLVASPLPPWNAAALLLVAGAFVVPAGAGFLLLLLPRQAKRAPRLPELFTLAGALLLLGAILLAGAFARPGQTLYQAGALLYAAGAVHVGAFALAAPFEREKPGDLLRTARPLLAAGGATLLVGAGMQALGWTGPPELAGLAIAGLLGLVAAATLITAGVCVLALPVALNAIPRGGAWSTGVAWLGVAAVASAMLSPVVGAERALPPAAVLSAGAVALYLWGMAPLRVPRRECPPEAPSLEA